MTLNVNLYFCKQGPDVPFLVNILMTILVCFYCTVCTNHEGVNSFASNPCKIKWYFGWSVCMSTVVYFGYTVKKRFLLHADVIIFSYILTCKVGKQLCFSIVLWTQLVKTSSPQSKFLHI